MDDTEDDLTLQQVQWERHQRRVRRTRDLGLLLLALGALVLASAALLVGR